MRSTIPLRARAQSRDQLQTPSPPLETPPQPESMSTIRLISAPPTATGPAPGLGDPFIDTSVPSSPFISVSHPTPLAPKMEAQAVRKRLVPKKSKLGLLVSGKRSKTPENNDFNGVVCRSGGSTTTASGAKGGFEIYVDPTPRSEVGEVLMVKKKKSRAALSGLRWGNLTDVTNSAPSKAPTQVVGLKSGDREKWWSIGRGRKDTKDSGLVEKENARVNPSRAPSETLAPRTRFNSLDLNVILSDPCKTAERPAQVRSASASESPLQDPGLVKDTSHVPTTSCLAPEEMHGLPLPARPNTTTGSIAIRAMRSMRSVARLANWTNGRPMEKEATNLTNPTQPMKVQTQHPKRTKKKDKRKLDLGRDQITSRLSSSSSEACVPANVDTTPIQAPTTRKHGVLGLGFPSNFRFGTMRSSSAGSCTQVTAPSDCRGRSSSTVSTTSSLRLASAKSRISSTSSASVKWVEERLETVKLACRRERIAERRDETQCDSKEVRPRGAVVDVFPEYMSYPSPSKSTPSTLRPIGTVEETLIDGHFVPRGEMIATPCRQTRVRPASDQMTGKERLGTICQDPDGVISALDAATNELASLINRLDLEATPGTPRGSLRLSPSFTTLLAESPRLKKSLNEKGSSATLQMYPNVASLPSRRPCQQPQKREDVVNTQRLGQQIAPWPISPPKALQVATPDIPSRVSTPGTFVTTSLASEQPSARPEPSIVFQSLRPAMSKKRSQLVPLVSMSPSQKHSPTSTAASNVSMEKSSIKFRSMTKKKSIDLLADSQKEFPLSKTFRKMMSTFSLSSNKEVKSSLSPDHAGVPMTKEARGALGLAGTLGGSMSSRNTNRSMDLDDPNCDIPNELQVILTGGVTQHLGDPEDTLTSFPASLTRRPPSPGLPPECPLPIPTVPQTSAVHSSRSVLPVPWMGEAQPEDPDESDSSSFGENDTKRSFDFTSELKSLSESAGTQRRSFVEQLENAFRTPAKNSLDGLGHFELEGDAPPMPFIPHLASRRRHLDESDGPNSMTSSPVPPLLPSPEIVVSKKPTGTPSSRDLSQSRLQKLSASSKPSYGQLNLSFKFGGSPLSAKSAERSQMTLSDIIPSPAHARSLSMASMRERASPQESSVPHVRSAPPSSYSCARSRVDSDSSSKRSIHGDSRGDACSSHSRASSQISFKGLETFDEIRRGFEFVENRPAFYPPPSFNNRHNQLPRDSMISIASVSSYGVVINPGVKDPFDYGYQSRPASADMSAFVTMSTSVDDTFSFIRRGRRRKRVDSDSSSFYFGASGASRISRPLRGQFRRDSVISTTSIAPPVSIYNRSFGVHRRIDSSSSVASGSHVYAAYRPAGANRSSWAPSHRRDMSADSVMSDTSVRISRPTLGDKMLDSRHDYCLPLTSITASPPESLPSDYSYRHVRRRGSFDSIMDDEYRSYSRDSIMGQSNRRSSSTPESVFGQDVSRPNRSPPDHFRINDGRPHSLFSVEGDSTHHKRDDDTMISMIGGGRVRRCSVGSFVERSPIFIRVGKRKAAVVPGQQRNVAQQPEVVESPVATQRIEKSPCGLGEERMVFAREGLLSSRDSLEEHCLCADGVETSFMAEPVFSRPVPVSRSRSGTHSSTSSGLDTPSLSSSGETSSVASDSISSIDLSRVNLSLTNMSYPIIMQSRSRIRSKGHGHRRRLSGIQISRTSVYETIEEENNTPVTDGFPDSVKAVLSPVINDNVIIVDPDDASSVEWDERGVVALRKYYTLKDEADITIKESKQLWLDTPFSIYAMQSFEPPAHRSGMRALLEHSRQTYGPLSAELRRIRSRTNSRPSPYPPPQRAIKISLSPPVPRPKVPPFVAPNPVPKPAPAPSAIPAPILATQTLQQRTVNRNTAADEISSLMPGKVAKGNSSSFPQSRLGPNARRSAPGWVKRGIGKENQERGLSSGAMTAPSESMRLNRPRPRGRPTHTRAIAPIRA